MICQPTFLFFINNHFFGLYWCHGDKNRRLIVLAVKFSKYDFGCDIFILHKNILGVNKRNRINKKGNNNDH